LIPLPIPSMSLALNALPVDKAQEAPFRLRRAQLQGVLDRVGKAIRRPLGVTTFTSDAGR